MTLGNILPTLLLTRAASWIHLVFARYVSELDAFGRVEPRRWYQQACIGLSAICPTLAPATWSWCSDDSKSSAPTRCPPWRPYAVATIDTGHFFRKATAKLRTENSSSRPLLFAEQRTGNAQPAAHQLHSCIRPVGFLRPAFFLFFRDFFFFGTLGPSSAPILRHRSAQSAHTNRARQPHLLPSLFPTGVRRLYQTKVASIEA